MNDEELWDNIHAKKYSVSDWSQKPTLFAEVARGYFPPQGRLLEIGTGQGQDAKYFQSLGYAVIATDVSGRALESARNRVDGVEFVQLDTTNGLSFDDESFDIVYSHLALHYFDNETTEKVFSEIHRVLKSNGVFATITNTIEDPEIMDEGYLELEHGFYETPSGMRKRYFSVGDMQRYTHQYFEPFLLDAQGETYKDDIKTLIRFVGRKR